MRRVGEVLKAERLKKGLSFSEIEVKTKIREKHLKAIEAGDYGKIGSGVYVFGFVGNYSDFLGLDRKQIEAFLRREIEEEKRKVLPDDLGKRGKRWSGSYRPIFLVFIVSLVVAVVGFYLFIQARHLVLAPPVKIFSPEVDLKTTEEWVIVEGVTDKASELFINDQRIEISAAGTFEQRVNLILGKNLIEVRVKSEYDKERVVTREVIRLEK